MTAPSLQLMANLAVVYPLQASTGGRGQQYGPPLPTYVRCYAEPFSRRDIVYSPDGIANQTNVIFEYVSGIQPQRGWKLDIYIAKPDGTLGEHVTTVQITDVDTVSVLGTIHHFELRTNQVTSGNTYG